MTVKSLLALTLSLTCLLGACGAAETTPAGALILDESAYCRAYAQFGCDRISPASLRKAAEDKLLSEGELKRLRGKNPDDARWQDSVYESYVWLQYGGSRDEADRHIHTPMPPADWVQPEFDDTRWLYQKKPLMIMKDFWAEHFYRRAAYFRFRFMIPDFLNPRQEEGILGKAHIG